MFAPVLASSLAFMLPAATPPNAIAFSYGRLKVVDLVSLEDTKFEEQFLIH